jgi:RNA 2',3'-cyclic 3'-phosphodiesterase
MPRACERQRLFIALWPSARVARQLAGLTTALHAECGGRKIIQQNQHITVSFLGDVAPDQMAVVREAMQTSAGDAFTLQLTALEYRRRGGMVWARATQVPAGLASLADALRAALSERGFSVEHRVLLPHVTLLRDAHQPAWLETLLLQWRVDELTLVQSHLARGGSRYEVIHRVPLAAGVDSA